MTKCYQKYTSIKHSRVAALVQSGAEIGLQFTNKCPVFPNTLKAHALMEYAKEVENGQKQNDVAEKLFKVSEINERERERMRERERVREREKQLERITSTCTCTLEILARFHITKNAL